MHEIPNGEQPSNRDDRRRFETALLKFAIKGSQKIG